MKIEDGLAEFIIEQAADALIYADTAGVITRWNDSASRVFGFTAQHALGNSLDLIIPERLRAAHWAGFNAAMANASMKLDGRPTVTRALHSEGRRLYVEMTFAVVTNRDGKALGAVAVVRDVTERVEKERAAR